MPTPADTAKQIAADIKAVFLKHKLSAHSNWREIEPGKVVFTATIIDPKAKAIDAEAQK